MQFDSDPNSVRIEITQESAPDLAEYATIPIAFEVREVARVSSNAPRSPLTADPVAAPYVKDYDANGNGPTSWQSRFDLSHWAIFVARVNGQRVGGAAMVHGAPDVDMLEARHDVALLWDIRVAPAYRGKGIGAALLEHGEAWARAREVTWLEVETQDINVPACRFYARHEFELRVVTPDAYPELPDETQLLWYKRLSW
jgi:GNAT superfamily N-acetyltransferase